MPDQCRINIDICSDISPNQRRRPSWSDVCRPLTQESGQSARSLSGFTKTAGRPRLPSGTEGDMLRVRIIAATTAIAMGTALAGCSSISMPDWLSFGSSGPALQTLQFESAPEGADVHTSQGQTCHTPCALALPVAAQAVTFSMNGYIPQTVPLEVHENDRGMLDFSTPAESLAPNPVQVALQVAPPPRPPVRARKRPVPGRAAVRTPHPTPVSGQPPPPTQNSLDDRFPPASSPPASPSPFPPPPQQR